MSLHCNAYVSMSQCVQHVEYQLPNEMTRVTYLLDSIECDYAELQAAMALVRNEDEKRNNFEATAAFLLPHCPVAKKRNANATRKLQAQVSEVNVDGTMLCSGIGKTGVEFWYYTKQEYKQLSKEQKGILFYFRVYIVLKIIHCSLIMRANLTCLT